MRGQGVMVLLYWTVVSSRKYQCLQLPWCRDNLWPRKCPLIWGKGHLNCRKLFLWPELASCYIQDLPWRLCQVFLRTLHPELTQPNLPPAFSAKNLELSFSKALFRWQNCAEGPWQPLLLKLAQDPHHKAGFNLGSLSFMNPCFSLLLAILHPLITAFLLLSLRCYFKNVGFNIGNHISQRKTELDHLKGQVYLEEKKKKHWQT